VSGYHYTGSGNIGDAVVGESHAWLEAWVGEWMPVDPTSGNDVGQKHVVVAYGRDYNDVSPMRGIFSGGQSRAVDVTVTMTRQPR
jgi:transglutaminase-like putative cysteine protease